MQANGRAPEPSARASRLAPAPATIGYAHDRPHAWIPSAVQALKRDGLVLKELAGPGASYMERMLAARAAAAWVAVWSAERSDAASKNLAIAFSRPNSESEHAWSATSSGVQWALPHWQLTTIEPPTESPGDCRGSPGPRARGGRRR